MVAVPTLRRERPDTEALMWGLAEAFVAGVDVDWEAILAKAGGTRVQLPTYAFQRTRYWLAPARDAKEQYASTPGTSSGSLLHLRWSAVATATSAATMGEWALLGADGDDLATALGSLGMRPRVLEDLASLSAALDTEEAVSPSTVLVDCTPNGLGSAHAGAAADEGIADTARGLLYRVLGLAQAWLADERLVGSRLVLLTRGAVAARGEEEVSGLAQAPLWGLVRSAQSEHPGRFVLVDVDGAESLGALGGALGTGEPQLALRQGEVLVPRFAQAGSRVGGEDAPVLSGRGTALITGGLGGLGRLVSRHLVVQHGVGHLLLASRGGLASAGAPELKAELEELGGQVSVAACDVSDREQLKALLDSIPGERPLSVVVHAAGAFDNAMIESLGPEKLDAVLASKLDGALHLHELTGEADLEAFVLFSSVAGVFGGPGQGNYAAGNAFLDALAARRRARGEIATSIAWPLWSEVGAGRDLDRLAMRRVTGSASIGALSSRHGLELFDEALSSARDTVVPVRLDGEALHAEASAGSLPPVLRDLASSSSQSAAGEPGADSLAQRLAGATEIERERMVLDLLCEQIAIVLGHGSPAEIDAQRAFKELGFDSLTAVELRNRLNVVTGLRLPATLVFDHPTAAELAAHLLRALRGTRLDAVRRPASVGTPDEPIAIVGMSCRLPGGVRSAQELWELVAAGADGISGFPADRGWDLEGLYDSDPDRPGESYAGEGGFVSDADRFDAAFFGISPRESLAMDPQQRLLLEGAWEVFEGAGIDPASLKGSPTGVFVGIGASGYGAGGPAIAGYRATNAASSVASGRLSYTFGLEGPAVSVDTACSSSLVALHLACQALRSGECEMALAGGVTVMASPDAFVEFAHQRGLSSDGRCKSFAQAADGVGWGEGAGLLLLERLSDARRNGHEPLALVRGSAVNQDGASNGLTAPNGPSQERVIAQALASAGLAPAQVDAVEAHGTGTTLGDPIEAQALLATYGQNRPAGRPLWLGSVKSNIGHTQAAAGVAGVIKMVMAMRHGLLPKTLHVDQPSMHVDWSAGAVSLLSEERSWEGDEEPRRAGVSSFGISGTNAHVILEQAPAQVRASAAGTGASNGAVVHTEDGAGVGAEDRQAGRFESEIFAAGVPLTLSGKTREALRAQAERLRAHLQGDSDLRIIDVGCSLASRGAFEHRAVVLGGERGEIMGGLEAVASGNLTAGVIAAHAPLAGASELAFLFTGQGAQRAGMGRDLYGSFGVFRDALDELCQGFAPHLETPLLEVLFASAGSAQAALIDRTLFAQAGLFALEVALFRLIESWGVRPSYLMGHSIGELAAAHVAGVFSARDACALVAARGRLMDELPEGGAMVSIQASERELAQTLERYSDRVALAAVNGPLSVVISGEEDAVLSVADGYREQGRKTKRLQVSHAFHSHLMDGMLREFEAVAESLTFSAPRIPVVSNVTGEAVGAERLCSAAYWVEHVRRPVRFLDGLRWLGMRGVRSFLELGPDGVLSAMVQEGLGESRAQEAGGDEAASAAAVDPMEREAVLAAPLLRGGRPEIAALFGALAEMWVRGGGVRWAEAFRDAPARRVPLPTYAFQRERYWLETPPSTGDMALAGQSSADHPMLGATVGLADGRGWLFTGRLSLESHPWMRDHVVLGAVLLPGTAFLELALHAGAQVGSPVLSELTLEAPLILPERGALQLQVSVGEAEESGDYPLVIHSRLEAAGDDASSEARWTRHASGVLCCGEALTVERRTLREQASVLTREPWPPVGSEGIEVEEIYDVLAGIGLEYGPVFQGLRAVWRRGEEVFAEVSLAADQQAESASFGLHPALLDAVLHADATRLTGVDGKQGHEQGTVLTPRLPFTWTGVELHRSGASSLRVSLARSGADAVSLVVADEDGGLVASVDALVSREVSAEQLGEARGRSANSLFCLDWATVSAAAAAQPGAEGLVLLGGEGSVLARSLRDGGRSVEVHADLESLGGAVDDGGEVPEVVLLECAPEELDASESVAFTGAGELASVRATAYRVLGLLQDWLADGRFSGSRLAVVTSGSVAARAGDGVPGLAQSPVWGLVRSAQSENPGRFLLVDVDGDGASYEALAGALVAGEPQLAIRNGSILAPRVVRTGPDRALVAPEGVEEWRLGAGVVGTLEGLALVPSPEKAQSLGRSEVRVAMRAGGVNFRDVLIALGVYPEEATIGSEGAGVVLEIGAGVEDLAVGDRVLGLFSGIGPVSVTDRRLVTRVPEEWSFAQAASMPMAFLTACYGLVDLAGLKSGERVLIHAAAGGVGMAAVGLARHLGAEVFATASPAKWPVLRSMGLDESHIASSRSLEFRERFLVQTGGRGVDVVLDSLAGEFVDASLELLAEGGRFVEMGKADIRDPGEVAKAHPTVAYRAFDLLDAGPKRIGEMLGELLELFASGALRPLPVRAWDVRRAPEAFRFMSQARHTGKIVLSLPPVIDPRRTVLITGGTGTLGALTARHLVARHGVGRLLLVSRRGEAAAGTGELRRELESMGAHVAIAACDVSRREELAQLLDSIPAEHPLGGVVHAAGMLDDGVIGSLTAERLERVLLAKADAAWHLHELTEHMDLSLFVLFSSAAAAFGSPGQSNYAAANAFLDALAAHRRARGLPAGALAWGPWEQASEMTAGLSEADVSRMGRFGLRLLGSAEGLELFDGALGTGEALTLPVSLDLAVLRAQARMGALPALFSDLVRVPAPRPGSSDASLARRLAATPEPEREAVVMELVRAQVAAVLGHPTSATIDTQSTFKDLGFDSLTAVELRNRLNRTTGLRLPATLVFDYPTTTAIAWYIAAEITKDKTAAPGEIECDRLESVLPAIASNDGERARMTARLQALLSKLDRSQREDGGVVVAQKIDSASDDELFRYLDEKAYASRAIHAGTPGDSGREDDRDR